MFEDYFYGYRVVFFISFFNLYYYLVIMGLYFLKNIEVCFVIKCLWGFSGWEEVLLDVINGMVVDKNVKDVSYCFSLFEILEYVFLVILLMEIYYFFENFLLNFVK